jgi:hypothetical protein
MIKLRGFFSTCFLLVSQLLAAPAALAWDGQVIGVPFEIDITDGGNLGVRVYLVNATTMCGNSNNWPT